MGPTGSYEKNLTLLIAKDVQDELKKAGAHVIMTRTTDASLGMIDRNLMLRRLQPDLMLSIHLNAAADPIHVEGTSTYYRYIGFRPLSLAIYKRMVALGLDEYGNVGSFNFALNGPTEYPNALVETLFLSNPADEARALDPAFRRKMAGAIVQGIEDFLQDCAEVSDPSKK
jgi:N-acetylmuramoyl-L-alanine amidase